MRRSVFDRATMLLLMLSIVGCDDPLDQGQVIDRLRVLGARVSVNGDASRASAEPEQTVELEWLVVAPGPVPEVGWGFWACAAAEVRAGLPRCLVAPFAEGGGEAGGRLSPRWSFHLPASSDLLDATSILVAGAICDGEPSVHPGSETASCGDGEGTLVSAQIPLDLGVPNQNPNLQDDVIRLGDTVWEKAAPADPVPGSACVDLDVVKVRAGGTATPVDVAFVGDDREPLEEGESPIGDRHETLTLSHFSTAGVFERQFSVLEADAPSNRTFAVSWTPPERVGPGGLLVQFVFVLRDGRGGTDWTFRFLCATP